MSYQNNELYHYSVKGMKWGHRKKRETAGPRTNWGKNRAYAREQDAADKAQWKAAKAKVKSGQISKKSAEYKAEKKRHSDYQYMRNNYTTNYGMTKAARGKQMQKLGISADKPVGTLKTSKAIKENAKAMAKQYSKVAVGYAVATGAAYVGAKYLNSRMNMNVDTSKLPRLETGNIINLKPHQYKVS